MAQLMMQKEYKDLLTCPLLWIAIPQGNNLKATKMDALANLLAEVRRVQPKKPIVCMLPWKFSHCLQYPHKRWSKILASFQPASTVHCLCSCVENSKLRYRVRMFTCNIRNVPDTLCDDCKKGLCEDIPHHLERYFIRRWIGKYLQPANWETQESALVCDTSDQRIKHVDAVAVEGRHVPDDNSAGANMDYCVHPDGPSLGCPARSQQLPDSNTTDPEGVAADTPTVPPETAHYPTDARERQKVREKRDKEAGITREVKKKKVYVEPHYDDCGEDVSKLDICYNNYDGELSSDESDSEVDGLLENIEQTMFWGDIKPDMLQSLQRVEARNIEELSLITRTGPPTITVAEVCGGQARTTQIAVRKRLATGRNLDLTAGCDLTKPQDRRAGLEYFTTNDIGVAVLAPICGPFGALGYANEIINPVTWAKSMDTAYPVAEFCGLIANIQLGKNLDFLLEQPHPSRLYGVLPWPKIMNNPQVEQVMYHRCMCGLKVLTGQYKGMHIKKPSMITASSPELILPFKGHVCKGKHEHLLMEGHRKELKAAEVWTWNEAQKVVYGIEQLMKRKRKIVGGGRYVPNSKDNHTRAFPINPDTVAKAQPHKSPQTSPDARALPRELTECKGCKVNRASHDWTHNRIIHQCRWPYVDPFIPTCDGCISRKKVSDKTAHTFDEGCAAVLSEPRDVTTKVYQPRKGQHPRDPAVPATGDATADMRASPDGQELGQEHEDATAEAQRRAAEVGPSSSSADGGRYVPNAERRTRVRGKQTVKPTSVSWDDVRVKGGTPSPDTWTHFDVQKSVRALNCGTVAQQTLTIRKLHIRWWHATAAQMTTLLRRAGCGPSIESIIKQVTQTCRICRQWQRVLPQNVASVSLPDHFNETVEADLMFVYDKIVLCLIDCATRFLMVAIIPDRNAETLKGALETSWIALFGAMKKLVMDSETGIYRSKENQDWIARSGIRYIPRARGQQIATIDRRIALLREQIHKGTDQLRHEKVTVEFSTVLSESVFAISGGVRQNAPHASRHVHYCFR